MTLDEDIPVKPPLFQDKMISIRELIGINIIIGVFGSLFSFTGYYIGLKGALIVWGGSISFCAVIVLAVYLIAGEDEDEDC